jgi:TetR/AcrR family transcriptional regulator, tetracycline repressor protein
MATTEATDAERTRLSKAVVIDRALAIGDAEGLDAVTIRRVANELGVTPMALYWHFRAKDELLAGLADRIWGEIDTDVGSAGDWPQQLRRMLESLVRVLRAHPCASQLLASTEKLHGDAALGVTETALEVLRRGGFDPVQASEIARGGLWTALMLVMSAPGYDPGVDDADRAEMMRLSQVRLAMLPPGRYPRLVEAAAPMTACAAEDQDFHYRFGIDLFIAGVRAMAPPAATGPTAAEPDAAARGAEDQGQAAAPAAGQPAD